MLTKGLLPFRRCWWMHITLLLIPLLSFSQTKPPVADMHYHISMKAYNNHGYDLLKGGPVNKKWVEEERSKGLKIRYNDYWIRAKATNSNLKNFTQATMPHTRSGNVRLAFNAITPFEYSLNDEFFDRLFSKFFKTGASLKWLKCVGTWDELTHFSSYNRELQMLCEQDSNDKDWMFWRGNLASMDTAKTFVVNVLEGSHVLQDIWFRPHFQFDPLMNKKNELRYEKGVKEEMEMLQQQKIEHRKATGSYTRLQLKTMEREYKQDQKQYKEELDGELKKARQQMEQNQAQEKIVVPQEIEIRTTRIRHELDSTIDIIKSSDPPVFMVTVGHLAFNGMIGHAPALDGGRLARGLLRKFYRTRVSNDQIWQKNWDDKFHSPAMPTEYGYYIIDRLIDEDNGHRIYIDLKHSSYSTREWFYESVARPNKIPPICSHCAANGLSKIHYSVTTDEYAYADSKSVANFYPMSINLYDEEIATICELGGIIGITLEERVLGGYMNNPVRNDSTVKASNRRKENLKKLKHLRAQNRLDDLIATVKVEAAAYQQKLSKDEAYKIICSDYLCLEPFMQNLFYMIDKSGKGREAWKHLCIGSDLDGLIDPLDIIPTASQYPYFRNRLKQLAPFYLELRDNNPRSWETYFENDADIDKKLNQLFYESLSEFVVRNFRK